MHLTACNAYANTCTDSGDNPRHFGGLTQHLQDGKNAVMTNMSNIRTFVTVRLV